MTTQKAIAAGFASLDTKSPKGRIISDIIKPNQSKNFEIIFFRLEGKNVVCRKNSAYIQNNIRQRFQARLLNSQKISCVSTVKRSLHCVSHLFQRAGYTFQRVERASHFCAMVISACRIGISLCQMVISSCAMVIAACQIHKLIMM